jgi:hypothetical protein
MNAENNETFDNEIFSLLNEVTSNLREEIYEFKNTPFKANRSWFIEKGRTSEKHSSLEILELVKFMLKHRRNPRHNEQWMLKY